MDAVLRFKFGEDPDFCFDTFCDWLLKAFEKLDEKQKKIKIANLLTKLKKKEIIDNNTRGNISEWWACK